MGSVFGLVMVAAYGATLYAVREPVQASSQPSRPFWHDTRTVLRARGFLPLLVLFSTLTLGMGTLSAVLPFFLVSRLGLAPALQTALLALLFVTAAFSVPLWTRLSRRLGKRGAFAVGLVLLVLSLPLLVLFSPPGALSPVLVGMVIVVGAGVGAVLLFPWALLPDVTDADANATGVRRDGLFYALFTFCQTASFALAAALTGGVLLFPWALLPDVTDADANATGVRRDGLFYALFTFCQTASFALAAALTGGVLELSGYISGAPVQSLSAVRGVSWLVGGVAAGVFLLALVPLRRYRPMKEPS